VSSVRFKVDEVVDQIRGRGKHADQNEQKHRLPRNVSGCDLRGQDRSGKKPADFSPSALAVEFGPKRAPLDNALPDMGRLYALSVALRLILR
jgi:hypothetical protein